MASTQPLFLLGAGASKDARLPLANEITARALEQIGSPEDFDVPAAALLNYIVSAIIGHNGRSGLKPNLPDIETVVSAVELLMEREGLEIVPFVQAWDGPVGSIAAHKTWRPAPKSYFPERAARTDQTVTRFELNSYGKDLAGYVFEELERRETQGNGDTYRDLHLRLMRDLRTTLSIQDHSALDYLTPLVNHASSGASVITTLNYDLTVETAADMKGVSVSRGVDSWPDTGQLHFERGALKLIKLHGSLDWTHQRKTRSWVDHEYRMDPDPFLPRSPSDHEEPAVIYGRRGKLRPQGPFLDLRAEFARCLNDTDCLAVVGYSFQDDHVNEVVRAWLRRDQNRWIVVVDPNLPIGMTYRYGNPFLDEIARLNPWPNHPRERHRFYPIATSAAEAFPRLCQDSNALRDSLSDVEALWDEPFYAEATE